MRADVYLFKAGFAKSRERARQMILQGFVSINGVLISKPSFEVDGTPTVHIKEGTLPYVSRGGLKLAGAISAFGLSVKDKRCCDIGSSTGGFTDCLLQNGAAFVYAVDSGTDQLDASLRTDDRVLSMEQFHAETLTPSDVGGLVDCVTMDVSFTSMTRFFSAIRQILTNDGFAVCLFKPQFEVGREFIGKGGIVRDRTAALHAFLRVVSAAEEMGLYLCAVCPSPITGQDGNREALMLLRRDIQARLCMPLRNQEIIPLLYGTENSKGR